MFPTLLQLSFFHLKSLTVLVALAIFYSSFVFWRKGREEHYNTFEIFDAFLSSGLLGFLMGRVAFVALHFGTFSSNIWSAFNIIEQSGNEPIIALVVAIFYIYRRSIRNKWDAFEVLDFYVTAISLGMVFIYLGFFLDGSYGGTFTAMPWGVVAPGTFEQTHPAQLYLAFYYLLAYIYLSRIEYSYRTIEWYRSGKKTAQSGFIFCNFLIFTSLFHLLTGPTRLPSMFLSGVVVDYVVYALALVFGLLLLRVRSGRSLNPFKK